MGKRITLTRKGFRKWLEGKRGYVWVGQPCCFDSCPIAVYLHDKGMERPWVGTFKYGSDVQTKTPMPKWAGRFVERIDHSGKVNITARQALAVLDGKEAKA